MDALRIQYLEVEALKLRRNNPRTHSAKQIGQIADSIRQFGFTNPILVDEHAQVIAGHGRLEAAKLLDLPRVPTIRLDQLSEAEVRAYVIADNKLAENAGWDRELLGLELQYLSELELDFDLELTGFETAEIDLLIDEIGATPDPADAVPEAPSAEAIVSRPGDLWQLGEHRLYCGNALESDAFETVLGDSKADLVFIDPPYNVPIDGHVSGLGSVKHREFAMAAGEMSSPDFARFLGKALKNLAESSVDGSIHFVCMDWRHLGEILAAGQAVYSELKNLCVWNKANGGMGSLYRSKHELIFVFKSGRAPHVNNIELGRYGRYRTNVWDYAGVNSFGSERSDVLSMHPTVKPVQLVADAILDCSKRGGLVLDCFGGSGSTLIAAERTGRCARLIELDPAYVDVTIRRFTEQFGAEAIHAESGLTFEAVRAERHASAEQATSAGEVCYGE